MILVDERVESYSYSKIEGNAILQMLRYVGNNDDNMIASVGSDGKVLISTRIVVTNTDVQHSGTYKCEPGSAPVASVNVHVLDGKPSLLIH